MTTFNNNNKQQQQQQNLEGGEEREEEEEEEEEEGGCCSKKHNIAMVCDFFYPKLGGVENHIYSLSYHLIQLGHKVIVITSGGHEINDNSNSNVNNNNNTSLNDTTNNTYNDKERQKKQKQKKKSRLRRTGVRYMPGPIKVYYVPFITMSDLQDTFPTYIISMRLLRHILVRECISIVHCHQATSVLANECIGLTAIMNSYLSTATTIEPQVETDSTITTKRNKRTTRRRKTIRSVYTDHSLFSIDSDIASVILNRVLQVTLSTANAVICVSHACCHNFLLRTKRCTDTVDVNVNDIDSTCCNSTEDTTTTTTSNYQQSSNHQHTCIRDECIVRVIPNAVSSEQFQPPTIEQIRTIRDVSLFNTTTTCRTVPNQPTIIIPRIVIVVISRLVYRKGVDLLVRILPIICKRYPHITVSDVVDTNNNSNNYVNVDFIIGGDGNKLLDIQEMIEREQLYDRIILHGSVQHESVPTLLRQGHIFLNCSLTESFCIAILEAASTGMKVVTTNVGGIPEVLPTSTTTKTTTDQPEQLLYLANPSVPDLVCQLCHAINDCRQELINVVVGTEQTNVSVPQTITATTTTTCESIDDIGNREQVKQQQQQLQILVNKLQKRHELVRDMYSWERVAIETINVYDTISTQHMNRTFHQRIQCYYYSANGGIYGTVTAYCIAIMIELWFYIIHYYIDPISTIDIVPDLYNKKNNNSSTSTSSATSTTTNSKKE